MCSALLHLPTHLFKDAVQSLTWLSAFNFTVRSGKLLSRYYNITYWPIWYIGEVLLHFHLWKTVILMEIVCLILIWVLWGGLFRVRNSTILKLTFFNISIEIIKYNMQ